MNRDELQHTFPDDATVQQWLTQLASGDHEAQQKIWEEFAPHVENLARQRLGHHRRAADEEDVATGVFKSLFMRLADGRQAVPEDRESLWKLLFGMTRNKAAENVRKEKAQKRGGGKVRGESVFPAPSEMPGLDGMAGSDRDPKIAFEETQALMQMLEGLPDEELQKVALLRMANHTEQEIADALGCSVRTAQRRMDELRKRFK